MQFRVSDYRLEAAGSVALSAFAAEWKQVNEPTACLHQSSGPMLSAPRLFKYWTMGCTFPNRFSAIRNGVSP